MPKLYGRGETVEVDGSTYYLMEDLCTDIQLVENPQAPESPVGAVYYESNREVTNKGEILSYEKGNDSVSVLLDAEVGEVSVNLPNEETCLAIDLEGYGEAHPFRS